MAICHLPPFAKLLRRYRVEAELTQEELAERAGVSARAISDLERGAKIRPHRVTVELLADALQLTAEDRAALLAAVPRSIGSAIGAADPTRDLLDHGFDSSLAEVRPLPCPEQLARMLKSLVGIYVGEERSDRQINLTVVMISVAEPIAHS
jgi:transcriptional regulator with XRE-family HTH domain